MEWSLGIEHQVVDEEFLGVGGGQTGFFEGAVRAGVGAGRDGFGDWFGHFWVQVSVHGKKGWEREMEGREMLRGCGLGGCHAWKIYM